MPDGPDVRALSYLFSAEANGHRPVRCTGCPFGRHVPGSPGLFDCDLLNRPGLVPAVNGEHPPCTAEDWGERARIDLARLEADNAMLTAVAHDAREESSMYNRGLAEGGAAEREACAKAVCLRCADGDPVVLHHGVWCHRSLTHGPALVGPCKADAIRRRAGEDGR
jgi:hypothetical protein